nr:hypothetical protein [uncultured Methanobrevibacter sp.]
MMIKTLLALFGFTQVNAPKYDLHKKPCKEDYINELRVWLTLNFSFIALAAIIGLIVFVVWFCFFVTGISAVESGMWYNNLDKVI